jgi:hypothetical protein
MGPLISQREGIRPPMTRLLTRIRVVHKQKVSSRSPHPNTNPRRQHSQSVDEVFHRTIAIQPMKGPYPVSRQQVKTRSDQGSLHKRKHTMGGWKHVDDNPRHCREQSRSRWSQYQHQEDLGQPVDSISSSRTTCAAVNLMR